MQSLGSAGALEVVRQCVQQAGRTAGPGLALAPIGHAAVELGDVPATVAVVVVLVQRVAGVLARERAKIAAEDRVLGRRGDVHVCDVGKPARAVRERSQHPHDRRHAAAGRHEQQRMLESVREDELPGRRREPDQHALAGMADEVLGHQPARDPLDGDGDPAVASPRHRRQRIRPPVPHAVDVDADAHVLARHVLGPRRVRAAATASRNRASRPPRRRRAPRGARVDQSGFSCPRKSSGRSGVVRTAAASRRPMA